MSESGICDGPVNSNLYAIVNIDNKTKKTDSLLKRASNKSEIFIPEISGSLQELSNSDSNLYATLLSVEEIQVSLSCSRTLYGSVDDIITEQSFGDIDQTETTAGSYLMRHKSGPIRKVPPPPPAKPPPYQKGEPDIPQNSKEMILRRSKSANSRNRFKFDNRLPLKPETEDSKKSNNKIGIKSFRRHKEITEKSTSGLVVSTSTPLKPEDKTIAPVQLPFKKCPLTGIPQDLFLLPRKLSPPDAKKLTNKQSPPENNSKTTSPPIPLPFQNPLRPPPPTNPKPAHVPKPPLKLPIQPNPGNTPISSLPSMSLGPDPPVPPPTASKNIKHPNRLPPPPPSHSLTLPRNLVDKPNSLRRSPSIGDYTLLTPVSPESNSTFSPLTVDYPTFSPLTTNEPSSPTEELDPLITGEGYSVLNINDCDNTVKDPGKKVNSFARTTSLPPLNSTAPINGVTTSRTKQEKLPPKKPPRRMTSSNLSPTALSNSSEYTILSSVDSEVALFIDKQNIMSTNANGVAPSNDTTKAESIRNLKTMTIASHGSRPVPPKPAAYRVRSKSQNLNNCLTTKSTPVEYTKSVEVSSDSKPVKQQVETTSEGLLSKMSKKFKNRTRAENTVPSISTPILGSNVLDMPHIILQGK